MHNKMPVDYRIIYEVIPDGSSVLDLGCGDGELIYCLQEQKHAYVQGIELDDDLVHKCVERGVHVFHGDIESGLKEYPNKAFDYVILNQSMQQLKKVDDVIYESLRIGRKVIVGFPNFAHYKARFQLFFKGSAPVTYALPYHWYDSPNLHFLSIKDFKEFCLDKKIKVEKTYFLAEKRGVHLLPNIFAKNAVFIISV
ncbi:MAG: methionine biosynthesis protein MetW [Elusimicrobiota bacterium]